MLIAFHHSDKPREVDLANAFATGARGAGHDVELRALGPDQTIGQCDVACMVGVKSRTLWEASRAAGVQTLMFDKGYSRQRRAGSTWEYWRMSLNAQHPTSTTLTRKSYPLDRFMLMGIEPQPWRAPGSTIVIAGSSAKYHEFYGLPDPTSYARDLIAAIRKVSDRPIIYRPKPSWRDAVPIDGVGYSSGGGMLLPILSSAHCMITHGSNACFDSACYGVPTVILGDGVTKSISTRRVADVEDVFRCHHKKRLQLLANIAYHQWTEAEMISGEAWQTVGDWIDGEHAI